jgi:hypothetical protein
MPEFCKGTLSYYAVCNNNPQCIELWVQLGTNVNYQGPRYMTLFSMAVVMEGAYIYFILIFFFVIGFDKIYFDNCNWVDTQWQ